MTPQQLRNSILQLAMEGKLVEQRLEEGTGEELYQLIQEEKQELIKAGKLKKQKELSEIAEDEIPFEIPTAWKWVKLGNVINYFMGKTPPRAEPEWWGRDIPWISISDMSDYGFIKMSKELVSTKAINEKFTRISRAGTLLMSFKLTVGRTSILDTDAVHNEAIISILPYVDSSNSFRDYLFYFLPTIVQWGNYKNAIKGKTLNSKSISNLYIPLPPIGEQKRIVEKITKILPMTDRYEKLWLRLNELNKRFPEELQKSILQEAIQGKLSSPKLEDGEGKDVHIEILNEKNRLITEGIIKKEKELNKITEIEIPFDIPKNWIWSRFGDLGSYRKGPFGSALTKNLFVPKSDDTVKVYEQKNAIKKDATLGQYYISKEYYQEKMLAFTVIPGDIIVSCAGTIGETFILPENSERGIINQALMRMRLFKPIYTKYFLLYFDFILKQNVRKNSKGSAIKNIPPFSILKNYLVPLPPVAEQKRIVEKVHQFLLLLEQYKSGIE